MIRSPHYLLFSHPRAQLKQKHKHILYTIRGTVPFAVQSPFSSMTGMSYKENTQLLDAVEYSLFVRMSRPSIEREKTTSSEPFGLSGTLGNTRLCPLLEYSRSSPTLDLRGTASYCTPRS